MMITDQENKHVFRGGNRNLLVRQYSQRSPASAITCSRTTLGISGTIIPSVIPLMLALDDHANVKQPKHKLFPASTDRQQNANH